MPIRLGPWGRASSLSPWSNAAQLIVEAGRQQGEALSNIGHAIGGALSGIGARRREKADRAEDMALEREKFDFLKENTRADNARASASLLSTMLEHKAKELEEAKYQAAQGDPDAAQRVQQLQKDVEHVRFNFNNAAKQATSYSATQPQGKG